MSSEVFAIIKWDQAYNRNGNSKLPRAVVNVIRTYMNNHTLTGWVKAETLAEATGMTVRGVRKQIAANVEAGWLVIAEPGNSSKASVYRLTYPDREPQLTVRDEERVNHSSRSTPRPCPTVHGKGEPQFTPTTPRTSPQEKFSIGTTPRTVISSSPFGEPEITGQETEDESPSFGGSLAIASSETTAETEGDNESPKGLARLNPATAEGSSSDDPFACEPAWLAESRAFEALREQGLQPVTAGGSRASAWG